MDWTDKLSLDSPIFDVRLFEIAGTSITVATLITFLLVLIAAFVLSLVLQRALVRGLRFRGLQDEGTIAVVKRLTHYAVVALGVAAALQIVGINLAALFATGAFLAIGIGFALQNILQNFVSGVILLMERSIKPGDILRVDGQLVNVIKMGIRATVVRSLDEEELIVPNSAIVQSTVTNYTLRDSLYRLRAPVGVVYGSDMRLVRQTLEAAAQDLPWRFRDKEPLVLLREFGDSSVNFEVSVWMEDPWAVFRARSELNERIWWALKEAGITIAFPQLDVHFDAPVMETLQGLRPVS